MMIIDEIYQVESSSSKRDGWNGMFCERLFALINRALVSILVAFGLGGCAGLSFYPDASMKEGEIGLKAYYSKPYILVARDGASKITNISVVYFPDLEHPVYAKAKSGYGSANLTMGFANGMITSFGQQTDTKIPESLTSLGGFNTSIATAIKTIAETRKIEKHSGNFGKYSTPLQNIAIGIRKVVVDDNNNVLTENQKTTLKENATELDTLSKAFSAPGAKANVDTLLQKLSEIYKKSIAIKPASDNLSEDEKKVWNRLGSLQGELGDILDDLKPKAALPPELSLYEVIMRSGSTRLREVPINSN